MDLALNNLQKLICHKKQTIKKYYYIVSHDINIKIRLSIFKSNVLFPFACKNFSPEINNDDISFIFIKSQGNKNKNKTVLLCPDKFKFHKKKNIFLFVIFTWAYLLLITFNLNIFLFLILWLIDWFLSVCQPILG